MASTVALVASLLVVGPWSGPARAETRNVGDADGFVTAVNELKLLPGDHTIFLTADIDLTDVPDRGRHVAAFTG